MEEQAIKVLHTCPLGTGGITSMVLNICDHMDKSKIHFDYLKYSSKKGFSEDRALALGGKIYSAHNDDARNGFMRFWLKFHRCYMSCKDAKPDIFHINASTPYDTLVGISAKLAGVKCVIVHSHNANNTNNSRIKLLINKICKIIMPLYTKAYFTCSTEAAQYMFPKRIVKNKKYHYIHNGINTKQFQYNEKVRNQLRKENGLENAFVIANVGRFFKQKNHDYLIEIFAEVVKKNNDAVLLLVGEGELMDTIKEKVQNMNLMEKVIFWGPSDRVNDLMQMMDVLVMPSFHEGLPVVGIEAQAAGLCCVFSDTITKEVKINSNCRFVSLKKSPAQWAEQILSFDSDQSRELAQRTLFEAGYDIDTVANDISDLYCSILKNNKSNR